MESELRKVARAYLSQEDPGHTLQPTALINEAYVRLIEWKTVEWQGGAHFYAVAAKLMRRVLVNHAVSRGARPSWRRSSTAPGRPGAKRRYSGPDTALDKLAQFDPRKSQLGELRLFGGLSTEEAAEVLGSSPRTLDREWNLARA